MLHFPPNCFFRNGNSQKNASEPLQSLGSLPITFIHQMLHQCNIFKENFHATPSQNPSGHKEPKIRVIRDSDNVKLNAPE